jgi:DNA mismatch endonuclease (patch repair protein)
MDTITPERRSENMRRIKGKGTKPERIVRQLAHRLGYRYRLHRRDLPGKPDLVFPGRSKIIFVHGCFWHQHRNDGCRHGRLPASKREYWATKLAKNVARDDRSNAELAAQGWDVLVIWECELRNRASLADRLVSFLGPPRLTDGLCAPSLRELQSAAAIA